MPLSKMSEIRELTDEALQEQIVDTKKQLFDLRFQKATRQLETTHQFKHTRHRLAQLLTAERERQIEQIIAESASEVQASSKSAANTSKADSLDESAASEAEEE